MKYESKTLEQANNFYFLARTLNLRNFYGKKKTGYVKRHVFAKEKEIGSGNKK